MGGWSSVVGLGKGVGRVIEFGGRNWKGIAAGVVGWKYFVNDESLVQQATEVTFGKDVSGKVRGEGVVGGLKTLAFGSDGADRSIGENIIDGVAGEGAYQNALDAGGRAVHAVGQGVSDVYHGVAGYVQGQDGQVQYQQPTDITAYQQQALMQQQMGGGGLFGGLSPFSGISNLASSILGGGKGMSLAALIPAAFLMFGNFGWMGKIASLFLGSLAMKNMRQQQVLLPQPGVQMQPGYGQVANVPSLPQQSMAELIAQNEEEENSHVVHRSRS